MGGWVKREKAVEMSLDTAGVGGWVEDLSTYREVVSHENPAPHTQALHLGRVGALVDVRSEKGLGTGTGGGEPVVMDEERRVEVGQEGNGRVVVAEEVDADAGRGGVGDGGGEKGLDLRVVDAEEGRVLGQVDAVDEVKDLLLLLLLVFLLSLFLLLLLFLLLFLLLVGHGRERGWDGVAVRGSGGGERGGGLR